MTKKVDRMLDLLVLVGYSVAFPVKLAKRLSGHEQYDRCVMYRAIREGYVLLMRREGKRQVIRSLQLTEKGLDYIACLDPEAVALIYGRGGVRMLEVVMLLGGLLNVGLAVRAGLAGIRIAAAGALVLALICIGVSAYLVLF